MKNSHCKSILSNETGKRFTWERREREREREREIISGSYGRFHPVKGKN